MTARLYVTEAEHALLCEVGDYLGGLRRRDLRRLCRFRAGQAPGAPTEREERGARQRDLRGDTSARIAGSIVRANDAEWSLAWRNLKSYRDTLRSQVRTLAIKVAVPAEKRVGRVRGYCS
ncbi:MAG: hypothetical protein OXL33_04760 [Chloroflexota bacterium]|nr:hypothetical protein [Chloroflexota bacterium]